MEIGEVLAILYGKMRQQLAINNHENWKESISESQESTIDNAKENMAKLIEVVIKDLAQRTAIVCLSSLFSIDCVQCLVPKYCKTIQEKHAKRQYCFHGHIILEIINKACHRENRPTKCDEIWSYPSAKVSRDELPPGIETVVQRSPIISGIFVVLDVF